MASTPKYNKPEVTTADVSEVAEVKETIQESAAPVKEVKRKKELDRNAMVSCKNITLGTLTYVSRKTQMETNWEGYGAEEFMDIGELITMSSSQPRFLKEPWLIIEDEDVIEYLGLKSLYDKLFYVDNIEEFFTKSSAEIKELLQQAPKGLKELIADKARELITSEKLYDLRIIKVLDTELNLDLAFLQE